MPAMRREFILKDLRTFFRDSTQWSQLILLGVLVLVYLFNIQALPLFTGRASAEPLAAVVASPPKPPRMTLKNERFMALHMM